MMLSAKSLVAAALVAGSVVLAQNTTDQGTPLSQIISENQQSLSELTAPSLTATEPTH
jgi:hypothetical protein